ncbi:hypothetical protein SH668x_001207 [Planctomicrobium sp. SH668]|uniref:hypothetical protein n=1 Tax=Planctomicrobium sp. SH668 TaxID=3448126 RepID=UPI003F5C50F2
MDRIDRKLREWSEGLRDATDEVNSVADLRVVSGRALLIAFDAAIDAHEGDEEAAKSFISKTLGDLIAGYDFGIPPPSEAIER